MVVEEDKQIEGLRRFNLVTGLAHAVQATLLLAFSNDLALPIQTYFLRYDPTTSTMLPSPETWFYLPIGPTIALFMYLTAASHLLVSTVGYHWYRRNIIRHRNPARWYEYSITSSIMILVIALLCGINDLAALIPLMGINATMNLFGDLMELHNQTTERTDWTSFLYGTFAGVVPWMAIILYYLGAVIPSSDAIPGFVLLIVLSMMAFWIRFPINMILHYKKVGNWKDYLYGEKGYIILSLVSKSALAWQMWFGLLRGG
ncbi:MAG: heliorhodopsin HeR [Methanomassiliicoccus sp.]|nr:heliorhodopsin HeR [Methanomassiliicoccus sp.]